MVIRLSIILSELPPCYRPSYHSAIVPGLASLTTGVCFLLAIPIAPVVSAVPPLASGPILCLLGALMCSSVRGIDWDDFQDPRGHMEVSINEGTSKSSNFMAFSIVNPRISG